MAVEVETIALNRYAPSGSDGIMLYSTGREGGSGLTLGQLTIAVSMRAAAEYEAQSVLKMNTMSGGSEKLETLAGYIAELADGGGDWQVIRAYCISRLGLGDELPDAVDTYAKRMSAIAALKTKADAISQQQQTEMIDLQTLVNRRDVAYSASSNIVRALGTSQSGNAANF